MNIAQTAKINGFLFVIAIAMLAIAGCSTVTTELNPSFDYKRYQSYSWSGMCSNFHPDCDRFLQGELQMKCFPKYEKVDMNIFYSDESGYYSPSKIYIRITDVQTKDELLTIHYQRSFWAWNESGKDSRRTLMKAFRDAFKQSRKNHPPKPPVNTKTKAAPETP